MFATSVPSNDEDRRERTLPCGSGKKFKRCCGDPRAETRYSREDRATAFMWLDDWIRTFAATEQARAHADYRSVTAVVRARPNGTYPYAYGSFLRPGAANSRRPSTASGNETPLIYPGRSHEVAAIRAMMELSGRHGVHSRRRLRDEPASAIHHRSSHIDVANPGHRRAVSLSVLRDLVRARRTLGPAQLLTTVAIRSRIYTVADGL